MSADGTRRRKASRPRTWRSRLPGAFAALTVVGVITYAMLVAQNLRQTGASVDSIEAWTSQRASPAPSQSYMPELPPPPSTTAAATPVRLPPLPSQARSATVIYDRGGDVADTTSISPVPEAALYPPPGDASVAEEHLPAPPATRPLTIGNDDRKFRRDLESLLASDPEALESVRQLLDEPDRNKRAESLRMLRETFDVIP